MKMKLATILVCLIAIAVLILTAYLIHFILRIIELAEDEQERL